MLNAEAVSQRYNERTPVPLFRYRPLPPPQSVADWCRLVKALDCLIYQCSEGSVPETDTYEALEKTAGVLKGLIVSWLPEYQEAPWGMD